MPSNFILTLDTIGPAGVTLAIDGGAAYDQDSNVILNVGTTDPDTTGYQMKVWGDLAGGPATEGAAAWQAFNAALPATVTAGDGAKTINVRLRDDVWNESGVATDAITIDSTAPTVALTFDRSRVSKVAGRDVSVMTLTPNEAIQAWKVKVVPNSNATESQGTQIPATAGSIVTGGAAAAGAVIPAEIHGADLEAAGAEGDNVIKAFVRDQAGNWSVL